MNRKLVIALFAVPIGLSSFLAKPASAGLVVHANDQFAVDRQYDGRSNNDPRDYDQRTRRDAIRRDEVRRTDFRRDRQNDFRRNDRRVWIPGHYEPGFLGIGRHWVEGHWENR